MTRFGPVKKYPYKIESVEEFVMRGGVVKVCDFSAAHEKFKNFGRNFRDFRKEIVSIQTRKK